MVRDAAAFAAPLPIAPTVGGRTRLRLRPTRSLAHSRSSRRTVLASASAPPPPPPPATRREVLSLLSALTATAAAAAGGLGAPPPAAAGDALSGRTVVNAALSAYGLPQFPDVGNATLTPCLVQYGRTVVTFAYPPAWIVQRNSIPEEAVSKDAIPGSAATTRGADVEKDVPYGRVSPLTAGDYRRAEGVGIYAAKGLAGRAEGGGAGVMSVRARDVAALVIPGEVAQGRSADYKVAKDVTGETAGQAWRELVFRYETVTASGFGVERRMGVRVVVGGNGVLYALACGGSDARWRKELGGVAARILETFHVDFI